MCFRERAMVKLSSSSKKSKSNRSSKLSVVRLSHGNCEQILKPVWARLNISTTPRSVSNLSTMSLIYYSDLNIEKAKNLNPNTKRINAPESYKFIMCRIQLMINISKMNLSRKVKGLAYHILRTSHDLSSEENIFLKSLIKESRNDI